MPADREPVQDTGTPPEGTDTREALWRAFYAGFYESGEGGNGEHGAPSDADLRRKFDEECPALAASPSQPDDTAALKRVNEALSRFAYERHPEEIQRGIDYVVRCMDAAIGGFTVEHPASSQDTGGGKGDVTRAHDEAIRIGLIAPAPTGAREVRQVSDGWLVLSPDSSVIPDLLSEFAEPMHVASLRDAGFEVRPFHGTVRLGPSPTGDRERTDDGPSLVELAEWLENGDVGNYDAARRLRELAAIPSGDREREALARELEERFGPLEPRVRPLADWRAEAAELLGVVARARVAASPSPTGDREREALTAFAHLVVNCVDNAEDSLDVLGDVAGAIRRGDLASAARMAANVGWPGGHRLADALASSPSPTGGEPDARDPWTTVEDGRVPQQHWLELSIYDEDVDWRRCLECSVIAPVGHWTTFENGSTRCPSCSHDYPEPAAPTAGEGDNAREEEERTRELDALITSLNFRPERSRPVWRNRHTGREVVVLDLAADDHGGFQGGCRQFVVVTDEAPPPGFLRGRTTHSLHRWLAHWEPTRRWVPAPASSAGEGSDDGDR